MKTLYVLLLAFTLQGDMYVTGAETYDKAKCEEKAKTVKDWVVNFLGVKPDTYNATCLPLKPLVTDV